MFNGLGMLSLSVQKAYGTERIRLQPEQGSNNNSSKVIILAFDDSPKSQFTLAKPILDKYGLKVLSLLFVLMLIRVVMVQIKVV